MGGTQHTLEQLTLQARVKEKEAEIARLQRAEQRSREDAERQGGVGWLRAEAVAQQPRGALTKAKSVVGQVRPNEMSALRQQLACAKQQLAQRREQQQPPQPQQHRHLLGVKEARVSFKASSSAGIFAAFDLPYGALLCAGPRRPC